MGDKKLKDYKGKSDFVHDDEPDVINQEPIQHPPRIQHPNLAPGFKLQPSDEELVSYYIKNKIKDPTRFRPSFIPDTNIYDYLPEELLEGNKDMDAYFFSARNKKYQNGTRADRSVKKGQGHWRMGSKSKEIPGVNGRTIVGYRNSLKFYVGKNKKHGIATNWQMKEYVMCGDDKEKVGCSSSSNNMRLDDWVICRVHWHENGKGTESTAEVDSDDNDGNSINSTCNKKRRIEKERKGGKGQAGIKIEGQENVATSSNVPEPVPHRQYRNQFNYYNPQFVANNFTHSVMPSNSVLSIQHHPHNNYQYQFGGYSGMFHQQHQQQQDQQFEQHQQRPHQQFEQHHQQFGQ